MDFYQKGGCITVRRHAEETFSATRSEVAGAVCWVLYISPPYYRTRETVKDSGFAMTIRPSAWFVGTRMTVQLQPQNDTTRLVADTKSQWFILVDYPDFYNHFLRDFLCDVRLEIQRLELLKRGGNTYEH